MKRILVVYTVIRWYNDIYGRMKIFSERRIETSEILQEQVSLNSKTIVLH